MHLPRKTVSNSRSISSGSSPCVGGTYVDFLLLSRLGGNPGGAAATPSTIEELGCWEEDAVCEEYAGGPAVCDTVGKERRGETGARGNDLDPGEAWF